MYDDFEVRMAAEHLSGCMIPFQSQGLDIAHRRTGPTQPRRARQPFHAIARMPGGTTPPAEYRPRGAAIPGPPWQDVLPPDRPVRPGRMGVRSTRPTRRRG